MSDDVDWDEVQVVAAQGAIGVYTSQAGYIVVRERNPSYVLPCVIFHPQNAEAIIRAIIKEAELPFVLAPKAPKSEEVLAPQPKVKDPTAADRQRRRREKLRKSRDSERDNSVDVTEVTAAQAPKPADHPPLVLVRSPAPEDEEEVQETALTR